MSIQVEKAMYSSLDLWDMIPQIQCPTLIVRGSESSFLSKEDAEKMMGVIKRGEWVEILNSTHMPVQENFKVFKEALTSFLEKVENR
jgi:pimeloyl-ACP methyl ester carboxylesterase